ncbi:MAG: type I secretion C-terminal target domain-containing protein [Devosia sp.]
MTNQPIYTASPSVDFGTNQLSPLVGAGANLVLDAFGELLNNAPNGIQTLYFIGQTAAGTTITYEYTANFQNGEIEIDGVLYGEGAKNFILFTALTVGGITGIPAIAIGASWDMALNATTNPDNDIYEFFGGTVEHNFVLKSSGGAVLGSALYENNLLGSTSKPVVANAILEMLEYTTGGFPSKSPGMKIELYEEETLIETFTLYDGTFVEDIANYLGTDANGFFAGGPTAYGVWKDGTFEDYPLYVEVGGNPLVAATSADKLFVDIDNSISTPRVGFHPSEILTGSSTLTGDSGDNLLLGIATGSNTLSGGDGNDILVGRSENDILVGGEGDDTIYGNGGLKDRAVFGGVRADYDISADGTTITDTQGTDGTDTLIGVEILEFADGEYQVAGATFTPELLLTTVAAENDQETVAVGGTVDIDVLANDRLPLGVTLSTFTFTSAANGTVSKNLDDTLRYVADAGFTGVDEFTYTLDDGTSTSTGTVLVNVGASANVEFGTDGNDTFTHSSGTKYYYGGTGSDDYEFDLSSATGWAGITEDNKSGTDTVYLDNASDGDRIEFIYNSSSDTLSAYYYDTETGSSSFGFGIDADAARSGRGVDFVVIDGNRGYSTSNIIAAADAESNNTFVYDIADYEVNGYPGFLSEGVGGNSPISSSSSGWSYLSNYSSSVSVSYLLYADPIFHGFDYDAPGLPEDLDPGSDIYMTGSMKELHFHSGISKDDIRITVDNQDNASIYIHIESLGITYDFDNFEDGYTITGYRLSSGNFSDVDAKVTSDVQFLQTSYFDGEWVEAGIGPQPTEYFELIEFESGDTINLRGIINFEGTAASETLYGLDRADVISGYAGADTLQGKGGSDTYVWNTGDGNDVIIDSGGVADRILLDASISTNDVRFFRPSSGASGDLEVHIGSEKINIRDHYNATDEEVEVLVLDDGTEIDLVNNLTFTGTGIGTESVYGWSDDNTLIGEGGVDFLYGYEGDDTYVWNTGDGNDVIIDSGGVADRILLDASISTNDVRFFRPSSGASGDLEVHIGSEKINIRDHYNATDEEVEVLVLDDGTEIDLVNNLIFTGTGIGTESVYGWSDDNTLIGEGGVDFLYGYEGDDTYVWNTGDGNDVIIDSGGVADRILLGAGITAHDVRFFRDGPGTNGDLEVHIGSAKVVVRDHFDGSGEEIETLVFNDGTEIDLVNNLTFTGTDVSTESIYGWSDDNTLIGEGGVDFLYGYEGDDTYVWNTGDGDDVIIDSEGSADRILLGAGITAHDVRFFRDGPGTNGDLEVHIGSAKVVVRDHFDGSGEEIETLVFNDGTEIDLVNNLTFTGTDVSTESIYGWSDDNTLIGEGGVDFLYGYEGDDTYVWNTGDGDDVIIDSEGSADRILLGAGITAHDVRFFRDGPGTNGDLEVHIGSAKVVVRDHFDGSGEEIETLVFNDGTEIDLVNNLTFTGTGIGTESVYGWSDDNTLIGQGGVDFLYGYEGDDTLIGGSGNDTLNGGDGLDSADYSTDVAAVTVNLAAGTATDGNGDTDTLISIENVIGSDYDDTITGDANANVLTGGSGDDVVDGGADTDTVSYGNDAAGVSVNLSTGTATDGNGDTDTLASIENVIGSDHNDTITGDANANVLVGGAGSDTLDGGAGVDTVDYSAATSGVVVNLYHDTWAYDGSNTIASLTAFDGVGGTDTLVSIENITGSAYDDYLLGANHVVNTIDGGAGNDFVGGAGENDILSGGTGNDILNGSGGADSLDGGAGDDELVDELNSTVIGGTGVDTYRVAPTANEGVTVNLVAGTLLGMTSGDSGTITGVENVTTDPGNFADTITGNSEDNIISLGGGADDAFGGDGADTLYGGNGFDDLYGDTGADILYGENGNDRLYGGTGADTLYGGANDDLIEDQADSVVDGGTGIDTFVIDPSSDEGVTIDLVNGTLLGMTSGQSGTITGVENITTDPGNFADIVTGDTNDNIITLGGGGDDAFGGDGNDTLYGGNGFDDLFGDAGNDLLYGENGNDLIRGGDGDDTIDGGNHDDRLLGGIGDDTLNGGSGIDTVDYSGDGGAVTVNLATGTATDGNGDTDTLVSIENIIGSSNGDTLTGDANDNLIDGRGGSDTLSGGAGNDTLISHNGLDTMTGGADGDTFVFLSSFAFNHIDTITDFDTTDGDALDLSDVLTGFYDPLSDLITDFVEITDNGTNSFLKVDTTGTADFGAGTQVATLQGITGLTDEAQLETNGYLIAA